jgi:hypothetical protein
MSSECETLLACFLEELQPLPYIYSLSLLFGPTDGQSAAVSLAVSLDYRCLRVFTAVAIAAAIDLQGADT